MHWLRGAAPVLLLLFTSAGEASAGGIPIHGRVVDSGERLPARTEITLEPIPSAYERARLRSIGELGPEPVDQSRLDSEGYFELTAPTLGFWQVVVRAPGRLAMEYRLTPLTEAVELPDLQLRAAIDLAVRITDAAGKPSNAALGVYSIGSPGGWRRRPQLATAAPGGQANLQAASGERLRIEALANGYPLAVRDVARAAAGATIQIALTEGKTRILRITDHRQRPMAEVLAAQGSGFLPLGVSGDDGRLSIVLAADGPANVRVSSRLGWSRVFTETLAADPELQHDSARSGTLHLELSPPTLLRGRVLEADSREPIADALVWTPNEEATTSDGRGGYELAVPGLLPRALQVAARGYLPGGAELKGSVGEGRTLLLAPAAAVSGRVVDLEGEPLPRVEISAAFAPGFGAAGQTRYNSRIVG